MQEVAAVIEQHRVAVPDFCMERSWNDFWNAKHLLPFHVQTPVFQTIV
jgi:hypothetical protein